MLSSQTCGFVFLDSAVCSYKHSRKFFPLRNCLFSDDLSARINYRRCERGNLQRLGKKAMFINFRMLLGLES